MGVPKEWPDLQTVDLTHRLTVKELRRNAAGDWTIVFDADAIALLPDGREVRFYGECRMKGRQYGEGKPRGFKRRDKPEVPA